MLSKLSLLAAASLTALTNSTPVSIEGYSSAEPLIVTTVPDHVRPYVVRAYSLDGPLVGNQVYRFPVTGASSGGAFSLISTAATGSEALGVSPHQHHIHYENFFCLRGRFQLWTEKDGDSQARQFTPGDYGAVPQNTTHTFQLLDPFNEMVGVISPGGFEKLFYTLASSNYTSSLSTPFEITANESTSAGSDAAFLTTLENLDVYSQSNFTPRRDLVNGSAPSSEWHSGSNSLAENSTTPFYVAKGRGPQYINSASGYWQIISPFITETQSEGNFTQGTISLSKRFPNDTATPAHNLTVHTALEVIEGVLTVDVAGEVVQLFTGDVVFVPAGTEFKYWSEGAYTQILYVGGGKETLDQGLIGGGEVWDFPMFPVGTTLP